MTRLSELCPVTRMTQKLNNSFLREEIEPTYTFRHQIRAMIFIGTLTVESVLGFFFLNTLILSLLFGGKWGTV